MYVVTPYCNRVWSNRYKGVNYAEIIIAHVAESDSY